MTSNDTPLNSPDLLFQDLQRYRKRRRFLEKEVFILSRELDQVKKIELAIQQAYSVNREGAKELKKFAQPAPVKKEKTYELKCVDCGSDFTATWVGRKNCQECLERNPRAKAGQRNGLRLAGKSTPKAKRIKA